MNYQNKRIFISDLPGTFTKDELTSIFSKYVQVSSIDIKERKELGTKHKSPFFAYINVIADDQSLNKCFCDLSNTKFHGQYLHLEIARESFLERLKRERQEAEDKDKNSIIENDKQGTKDKDADFKKRTIAIRRKYNYSSSESQSDADAFSDASHAKTVEVKSKGSALVSSDTKEGDINIVIKSNKSQLHNGGSLKIPSVGKAPIFEITKNISKPRINDSEANIKRLQSLRNMKKEYAAQKSLIKNALSYGISKPNKKIVFDEEISSNDRSEPNKPDKVSGSKNNILFDEANSEGESENEFNFDVREQFQGKSGQKLLQLQSNYKNDRRFTLDERFMDADDNEEKLYTEGDSEAEKNQQLKILEEVLGKKVTPPLASKRDSTPKKRMVKFDPSQPEHVNLEIAAQEPETKKKRKEKLKQEMQESQNPEPEVSKEIFYKVPEKLTETFAEKPEFSLLNMFGRTDEREGEKQDETVKEIRTKPLIGHEKNPFKYDSSDDEDETADIPHKDTMNNAPQTRHVEQVPARSGQSVFWTEPFFFKTDDFRLQEGVDFIEKIKTESKDFLKIRRELKGIVKAKVRNNERKNKMFKKKLGGSRRRKHIRIKKALKR